eukprot:TRINITY_DN63384_c0_g1_i1.p1 TRINITY_DN63384_c0_g1~~TRINITY_DN63384_c0_g1_i1.p1  ORF type:complete len:672 (+),score=197.76 TRINITY_DN63384_c0_g1_i1:58-2073(+)
MSRIKGLDKPSKDADKAGGKKSGLGVDGFGNVVQKGERRRQETSKGPRTIAEALAAKAAREAAGGQGAAAAKSAAAAAALAAADAAPGGAGSEAAEEARRRFTRIDSFEGIFACLAPETPCAVQWKGRIFRSAAHALLAAQYPRAVEDVQDEASIEAARKAASTEPEEEDWARLRLKAIERIQRDKFRRSADFRKQLQDTGDRELVWENDSDAFFGSVRGKGQNQLGRVLMDIRTSIQNGTEFDMWLVLCCEMENEAIRRPPVELLEQKGGADGEKHLHRLTGAAYFKLGKVPANAVQALHPSVSREHAMILHTKADIGRKTGGVVIMDLGSKAGLSINGQKVEHSFVMMPLKNEDSFKLGASTRDYVVKVNLRSQIEILEQQQRDLLREVEAIDKDAADPIEAAKRAARDEATVFVGGLNAETEKADLLELFQDCGHIQDVRFPGAPGSGGGKGAKGEQPTVSKAVKGIAFVVFETTMMARRACGLSGQMFKEKKIRVAPATEGQKGGGKGDDGGKGKGKSKGKDRDDRDRGRDGAGDADAQTTSRELRAGMLRAAERGAGRRGDRSRSRSRSRRGGGGGGRSRSARRSARSRSRGARRPRNERKRRDSSEASRGRGGQDKRKRSRSREPPKKRPEPSAESGSSSDDDGDGSSSSSSGEAEKKKQQKRKR